MPHLIKAYLYKAALGAGILVLIGLVAADIWLWQSDDGSGQTEGAGRDAQDGFQVPGLPSRNITGDSGPASHGGSAPRHLELNVSESVGLEDSQGGRELTTGDGDGSGASTGGDASVNGPAGPAVQQEQSPAPSGGPSDSADVDDSVELVVRDAAGNIKQK